MTSVLMGDFCGKNLSKRVLRPFESGSLATLQAPERPTAPWQRAGSFCCCSEQALGDCGPIGGVWLEPDSLCLISVFR